MEQGRWPVFLYCERTAPGLLGEPINTASNAAFLVAAWLCWRLWRARGGGDRAGLWLIALIVMIGIGSAAFHAAPSRTTLLMDVVPIGVFVLSAVVLAVRRHLGAPWWAALAAGGFFLAASPAVATLAQPVVPRGGAGYVAPLVAMPLIAGLISLRRARVADDRLKARLAMAGRLILAASVIFLLSLTFRTLDRPMCGSFPIGLHFLWHMLNAAVLHLITRAHLLNRPREG